MRCSLQGHACTLPLSPRYSLQLGLTDARAALGTNDHPEKGAKLLAAGQSAGDKYKFLACPLSVAVVVETQDGSVAVLQRSRHAREAPHKWDAVSGDPEPSSVGIALSRVRVAGLPPPTNRRGAPASPADLAEPICTAVFDMAVSRVVDLLNLPSDQLAEPQLLGVVREERRYGSASACVLIKFSGSAADLERRFNSAHRSRNSPSALAIIPALQLLSTNTTEPSVSVRGCRVLRPEPGAFVQDSDDSDGDADEEGKSGKSDGIATEEDAVISSDEMTPAGKGAFELWRFHRQKQAASRRIASLAL